jgi:hypothetical protein
VFVIEFLLLNVKYLVTGLVVSLWRKDMRIEKEENFM